MASVKFVEMTDLEYETWFAIAVKEYGDDIAKSSGVPANETQKESASQFRNLLPDGRKTKSHYLYSIKDSVSEKTVGMIWIAANFPRDPSVAFIYDIRMDENFRGLGYGTATLLLLEKKVKELGRNKIALHVFGHNTRAIRLYERMGYVTTDIMMSKVLE